MEILGARRDESIVGLTGAAAKAANAKRRAWLKMIELLHDEVVIECEEEAAPEIERWLGDTLRGAVADLLGYEELAGEDVVETSIIGDWGIG